MLHRIKSWQETLIRAPAKNGLLTQFCWLAVSLKQFMSRTINIMEIFKPLPLSPLPWKNAKSKLGFHFRVKEEDKIEKHIGELIMNEPKVKYWQPFSSYVKGKYLAGKEFHSLVQRKKTVNKDVFLTSRSGDQKLIQQVNKTSGPLTRIRK